MSNEYTKEYIKDVNDCGKHLLNFRITYLPSLLRHSYHGKKQDRHHDTGHNILIQNKYDPNKHLKYNKEGLLQFSDECPENLKMTCMNTLVVEERTGPARALGATNE